MDSADVLIIGAGAAGLAAGIFAARTASGARVVLLDGARKPGAKILVSGGGRCNVTNARVTPEDYWGGTRPQIRSVLRAFDETSTIEWMKSLGVDLKLEPSGKYFPVTDSARTVLDALLRELSRAGAVLLTGARVEKMVRGDDGSFRISTAVGEWSTPRLILATGGLSLPKSGSDGWGLDSARKLGHSIVSTTPALSPLMLVQRRGVIPHAELSGVTIEGRLSVISTGDRTLFSWSDSLLFTHFGLSGPAALNASRHLLRERLGSTNGAGLAIGHPMFRTAAEADAWLVEAARSHARRTHSSVLADLWPERLANALAALAGCTGPIGQTSREVRRRLAGLLTAAPLECSGDRGYSFAETTAGGVDLREVDIRTMESRVVPRMHLCGEMLDVDGRIGGFNFQWAWATGYLAGRGAVAHLQGRA